MIPYGRQSVIEEDVRAVERVLRSDWLTTGPEVDAFEGDVAGVSGVRHAVAVSSGTAALHCAYHALGIGPGDEVIVPAMTFAATANAVAYLGGTPVMADVDPDTLLIDVRDAASKAGPATRAIVGVDYAGQPCDWDGLRAVAESCGAALVADACHSLGGGYKGRPVGSLADLSVYSFHPVKHVAAGEGGMIVTENGGYAEAMRTFRNHGIETDARQREALGSWFYEMQSLGFNYRLSDIHCALGRSQLARLGESVRRRREIAALYDAAFSAMDGVEPLGVSKDVQHAYHLYVVRVPREIREPVFTAMRERGIGVNVHYIPVHMHPWYQRTYGYSRGLCPVAEGQYEKILSLPMYPSLTDEQVRTVVDALGALVG